MAYHSIQKIIFPQTIKGDKTTYAHHDLTVGLFMKAHSYISHLTASLPNKVTQKSFITTLVSYRAHQIPVCNEHLKVQYILYNIFKLLNLSDVYMVGDMLVWSHIDGSSNSYFGNCVNLTFFKSLPITSTSNILDQMVKLW